MKHVVQNDLPLLGALSLAFPASSKNTLRSWIADGRVKVDGVVAKLAPMLVNTGQVIEVGDRRKILSAGIEILYEDDDLVVINKPTGVLSVATAFEKGETAHALLKKFYRAKQVFVVHRLDQHTSGVMVFALNQVACDGLKNLFEVHSIERAYTAVVEGYFNSASGTWRSYQHEDAQYVVHETKDESIGKLAITHYKRIKATKNYSELELRLETGRKNQIRVHCQAAGYPVVGDKKYGARSNPLKRLCLHAHLLGFQHPVSRKKLRFEVPPPESFGRLTVG